MTRLFFIFSTFAIAAASVASPIHKHDFNGSAKTVSPGVGACGYQYSDTDLVTAVNTAFWDSWYGGTDPNENPLCGRLIKAHCGEFHNYGGASLTSLPASRTDNGNTVEVTVADRFTEGDMYDLMLSKAAFTDLTDEPGSSIPVKWTLVDPPSNI